MTQVMSSPTAPQEGEPWVSCRTCRTVVYRRRLGRSPHVCPQCGHHGRLGARDRLAQPRDPRSDRILHEPAPGVDPLSFVDSRPYPVRQAEARERAGRDEAVLCATDTIEGRPVVVSAMDFGFLGGSRGSQAGERITGGVAASFVAACDVVIGELGELRGDLVERRGYGRRRCRRARSRHSPVRPQ